MIGLSALGAVFVLSFLWASVTAAPHGVKVVWQANPGPQTLLLSCPVEDVFYGGARGGGKTSGSLGDFAAHAQRWGSAARGVLFRCTYPQLSEVIDQSKEMYRPLGALYNKVDHVWTFPNGATLALRFLESVEDAENYQGHQYTWVCFEEAGNWLTPEPLDKIRACLRSTVVTSMRFLLTGNPGGPGHFWLKARYIDPSPPLKPWVPKETGIWRVFIPAKLEDNPKIQDATAYRNRLRGSGPGWLVAAWLHGDWSGPPSGGYFQLPWLRTYEGSPPVDISERYLSVDFAAGTTEDHDATAILPAGLTERRDLYFLPKIDIARRTPRASALRMLELADEFDVVAILVEKGHIWMSIRDYVEEVMQDRYEAGIGKIHHFEEMPTKVENGKGKGGRAMALAAMMEHGRVLWPQSELYETVIKPHFLAFTGVPGVKEADDEIDAAAHLAIFVNRLHSGEAPKKPKDNRLEVESKRRDDIRQRAERERRRNRGSDEYHLFSGRKYDDA